MSALACNAFTWPQAVAIVGLVWAVATVWIVAMLTQQDGDE